MRSQTVNPGGVLELQEIVGRDQITARLWKILERRSVYVTAERRMGKTSIVRDKMGRETPNGVRLIYMDVSRASTPLEFVEKLLNESRATLDIAERAKFFLATFGRYLANLELKAGVSVKLPADLGTHWKDLLESLLNDLAGHSERIVLAFDELPLMLLAIKRNAADGKGESVVMELLDTLRAARQTNPTLRMIYTGSLGLHHVLTTLQDEGYQNDPTNDMTLVEVEPLTQEYATELARRLLRGEGIVTTNADISARTLASATDGMPYYIQHLVEELSTEDLAGDPDTIERLLANRLTDTRDPWHLRYYDTRIDTHYPVALRPIARTLLDRLAVDTSISHSLEDLVDALDPTKSSQDPETVRNVLRLLGQDHYLSRDEQGGYRFRYPFIARVWKAIRS